MVVTAGVMKFSRNILRHSVLKSLEMRIIRIKMIGHTSDRGG